MLIPLNSSLPILLVGIWWRPFSHARLHIFAPNLRSAPRNKLNTMAKQAPAIGIDLGTTYRYVAPDICPCRFCSLLIAASLLSHERGLLRTSAAGKHGFNSLFSYVYDVSMPRIRPGYLLDGRFGHARQPLTASVCCIAQLRRRVAE